MIKKKIPKKPLDRTFFSIRLSITFILSVLVLGLALSSFALPVTIGLPTVDTLENKDLFANKSNNNRDNKIYTASIKISSLELKSSFQGNTL